MNTIVFYFLGMRSKTEDTVATNEVRLIVNCKVKLTSVLGRCGKLLRSSLIYEVHTGLSKDLAQQRALEQTLQTCSQECASSPATSIN